MRRSRGQAAILVLLFLAVGMLETGEMRQRASWLKRGWYFLKARVV